MTDRDDAPDLDDAVEDDLSTDDLSTDEPGDEADGGDRIATGILAAEHRAQTEISRRRRFLIGGAVLGLVVAGAWLATTTVLQQQANEQARQESARADARAAFAMAVVDAAEAYEPPATAVQADAPELRSALEEFLVTTTRSDEAIADEVERTTSRMLEDADTIATLVARDTPRQDEPVSDEAAVEVLSELEALRAEAGALVDEVDATVTAARAWAGATRGVNEALATYTALVESEPESSDPDELIEVWEDERQPLRALRDAARDAANVPGLRSWAGAHEQYAEDLLDWVDEAVELLQEGDVSGYNQRFTEEFAVDDQFGFRAAVADAVPDALESPVLLELGTVATRSGLVLEAIDTTERTVARVLTDDAPGDTESGDSDTDDGDDTGTDG